MLQRIQKDDVDEVSARTVRRGRRDLVVNLTD